MQRGIPKSIAASTHPSQPSYCRAQATLRSQTQPHWTNRLSSRKERGIWKQTAAIRAGCEINASNKATQTNYSSPLPSSALSNTEKQLGFLFRNPLLWCFSRSLTSVSTLCCLQRSGLKTCVEWTSNLPAFPRGASPPPSAVRWRGPGSPCLHHRTEPPALQIPGPGSPATAEQPPARESCLGDLAEPPLPGNYACKHSLLQPQPDCAASQWQLLRLACSTSLPAIHQTTEWFGYEGTL